MKQVDTIILVKDIKKADSFYRNLFDLEILHDWESMIVYKNRLSLHQLDMLQPKEFVEKLNKNNPKLNNIIIYLELEKDHSLEDMLIKLQNNDVEIIHGIYKLPWQKIIRVVDPDNNIIEIGEPTPN